MARNRMLNPEFWLDEDIAKLSAHARLLYMGLWGICDDNYATFPNRPEWVKAQVFPYEDVDIRSLLVELSAKGKIILFISDDHHEFFYIKNFFKHQKIDRPSKPRYPEFKPENSKAVTLDEYSVSPRSEVKLSKEKRSKDNTAAAEPAASRKQVFNPLGGEVIKAFEAVDPKNKTYYGNTTQRLACDFLLSEYGLEEVLKRITVLPRTNKVSMFPTINSPNELKEKWVKLQDAVDRKRMEFKDKTTKIIR